MKFLKRMFGLNGGFAVKERSLDDVSLSDPFRLECLRFRDDAGMIIVIYCNVEIGSVVPERATSGEDQLALVASVINRATAIQKRSGSDEN